MFVCFELTSLLMNAQFLSLNRHTLPSDCGEQIDDNDEFWEKKLQDGHPIILYLHGNSSSRYMYMK